MADTGPSKKISLVISDVDGTLVTDQKVLTPRAAEAVRKLGAAGIAFAVTSGRPPRGMAMLVEPLKLTTPIAGFNGGAFVRPDMTPIEEHLLDADVAEETVQLILDRGLDAWVFTADSWVIRKTDAPHVEHEQQTILFPPVVAADFGGVIKRAAKVVGVSDDRDLMARSESEVQAALGNRASAVRSQLYYLDVTPPEANKGQVVLRLSQMLGIPAEEIATIGDGSNDVLMFERGGLSIAMGNASAEVKAKAHFASDSCNDDGFAKAMERFILAHPPA